MTSLQLLLFIDFKNRAKLWKSIIKKSKKLVKHYNLTSLNVFINSNNNQLKYLS